MSQQPGPPPKPQANRQSSTTYYSAVTTLGELRPGAPINLEVDTLARYAVRYLEVSAGNSEVGLKDALRQAGYEAGNS